MDFPLIFANVDVRTVALFALAVSDACGGGIIPDGFDTWTPDEKTAHWRRLTAMDVADDDMFAVYAPHTADTMRAAMRALIAEGRAVDALTHDGRPDVLYCITTEGRAEIAPFLSHPAALAFQSTYDLTL